MNELQRDGRSLKICVIGLGYVGLPLSIVLAESGHRVIGVDIDPLTVQRLKRRDPHIYEKRLKNILKKNLQNGRFKATLNTDEAVRKSDVVIITVGTPVNANKQADLNQLNSSLESVARNLKKGHTVIIKSTVYPGATDNVIRPFLERKSNLKAGEDFFLAFAPERVVEGDALREFRLLPKIVGGVNDESARKAAEVLKTLGGEVRIVSSTKVAEVIKLVDNIYRDVNIALGNEFGIACEILGIDAYEVCEAANKGYPRNHILVPGPGAGGYCLPKDPHIFCNGLQRLGCKPRLISLARKINEEMPLRVVKLVQSMYDNMQKPVKGSKIFVLGVAFKGNPETDDTRNTPAKPVIMKLKALGARVFAYDPIVQEDKFSELGVEKVCLRDGFKDASCLIVMTNHRSFFQLDLDKYAKFMCRPACVVDCWHVFNREKVVKLNLYYGGLGIG